ncbi:MAG: hypothetical protein HY231_11545 [Acidobacteria bacterium]|nr:hypothetical protein [Acidobacteriota bacterium]
MGDHCPDTESLAVYLEHKLSVKETAKLEGHFAGCRICREIIAQVIKSEAEIPAPNLPGAVSCR